MVVKKEKLTPLKDLNLAGDPRLMESKDISDVFALYKKQMERY